MEEGDLFLDDYQGQTVEELIGLQSTHRIDSLVLAFESALDSRKESGIELNHVELVVLAVEAFEREINNGGFSQFFYNSSVEYAPIIVAALNDINCQKIANLTQKAIDLLDVQSLTPDHIEERMDSDDEELEEALDELDEEYYEGFDDEVPAYALFEYIKANRASIRL